MDIRWYEIESWHIIEFAGATRGGNMTVRTLCGLERLWDGTFLDRLPGGSEKSCENCLRQMARGADEPASEPEPVAAPAPKPKPAAQKRKR